MIGGPSYKRIARSCAPVLPVSDIPPIPRSGKGFFRWRVFARAGDRFSDSRLRAGQQHISFRSRAVPAPALDDRKNNLSKILPIIYEKLAQVS